MKHQHLLVRGRGRARFGPVEAVDLLRYIVDAVGMWVAALVGNPLVYDCATVDNEGVTVSVLCVSAVIETSHCVLHIWTTDAHDLTLFQFDLYSRAHFDPIAVCRMLKDRLDLVTYEHKLIDRTIGLQIA